MSYLLDTNACIAAINDQNSAVAQKLITVPLSDIFLCHIVKAELYYGAYKSQRQVYNLATIERFCAPFQLLVFDSEAADVYGQLRADLERKGSPIGPNDLIIAATAVRYNMILVTNNAREFGRVSRLQMEDWL